MNIQQMQYKKTNHFGHAIMTFLFFPWVLVWLCCAMSTNNHNNNVNLMHAIENSKRQSSR